MKYTTTLAIELFEWKNEQFSNKHLFFLANSFFEIPYIEWYQLCALATNKIAKGCMQKLRHKHWKLHKDKIWNSIFLYGIHCTTDACVCMRGQWLSEMYLHFIARTEQWTVILIIIFTVRKVSGSGQCFFKSKGANDMCIFHSRREFANCTQYNAFLFVLVSSQIIRKWKLKKKIEKKQLKWKREQEITSKNKWWKCATNENYYDTNEELEKLSLKNKKVNLISLRLLYCVNESSTINCTFWIFTWICNENSFLVNFIFSHLTLLQLL